MSAIINLTITNNGAALLDLMKTKTGTFTKILIGDGYCLDDFSEVESMISPIAELEINSYDKDSDTGVVTLYAEFDNTISDTDFYYRELGLFALDPDTEEEILFAYGNANDYAEYIPYAETDKATIKKSIVIPISVGNADNVTVSINTSYSAYQKLSEKGTVNGYASLDESGKVPAEQLPQTDTGANLNLSNLTATGMSQYNAFSVNTGNVSDSGEPAFLSFSDGTNSTLSSTVTLSDLADFQAVTDGSVTISINNETYNLTSLDFSAAEDYAGIAEIIQTAIQANTAGGEVWTAATVTYDETSGSFILTAGEKGAYAIGYATTAVETTTDDETEEETTSVIGTDISSLIGWSEADNPTIITGDPYTLSTSGDFDVTTADGTIYNISETLTYSANKLEDGNYNIFINPVEKTIELIQNKVTAGSSFPSNASSGDFLLNMSKIPYDLQEITITTITDEETEEETTTTTITKGLNLVLAGTLTISGGGGNLTLHGYNSNGLTSSSLTSSANAIGEPVITLLNDLNDNEIWLEGAEVSKTTYSALYEIYGDTYGTPENEDNFILPDFRDRVIQGGDDFGYIEAGLPDHRHSSTVSARSGYSNTGAAWTAVYAAGTTYTTYASSDNSIYGNSDTVQPPAIKVRVKTRYA